ncbi:MAG: hypothetical protein ACHQJ6_04335 [Candidatus Berkiellales bacterium]
MAAPGGRGLMGELQAAQVLNNPQLAREYVPKAVSEMLQEQVAKVQTIISSKKRRELSKSIFLENQI